ncbi:MAG: hypothetical protein Q8P45_01020 [Candidatus Harrisonbacteria bacterium]|nr:hypothetical protein [Candidatus Harrisonbacteria bacterium]
MEKKEETPAHLVTCHYLCHFSNIAFMPEVSMKNILRIFLIALFLADASVPKSYASGIVNDPIHTAVSEIQNTILNSAFAKDIALAIERLNEMKTQTLELFRFHAGLDDVWNSVIGEPLRNLIGQGNSSLQNAFSDFGMNTPQIEMFQSAGGPQDIRAALEEITGKIPETDARPYLVFDEMQVVDAFDFARQIREAGGVTRSAATQIAEQAANASPKGAVRLQAQATSQLIVLNQQNQEAMAKLIELEATKIAQVTREEKHAETERLKFMEDAGDYADSLARFF